ncbi:FtsX-like permease family protein [Hanamia caeni]|uniref:FtsX-like permease family protein n=1 Tax=Hanamia caeni TaxID=2294116 RepID=A0A3M9N8X8_9BACT|nr:ABC transporter permease [Hanamia caeni]RNI34254.1 FtsX-like permease family protein [Hanamia caeni]
MIHNYLKTTFRNLWKNKGFTFLNIFGLGIGIACASLIFLWVEDEINFNNYFSNKENLYKIKDSQTYDGTTFTFDATPGPLAAGIKTEIPGIKNTARASWGNQSLFSLGDKNIYERGMYVDSSFLKMFQLQFVQGNASKAFEQLQSLVITEKMAHKFFGNDNAIGKSLRVDNNTSSIVTGVISDLPESVSFQFDWLAPFKIFENQNNWLQSWRNNGVLTYVELQPGADPKAINRKLYNYVQSKAEDAEAKMSVYPMSRWRLYDSWKDGKEVPGRIKYVNLFSLIAWIILLIACINFMNLSTARSEKRAREVGVRKVLGAGKSKLVGQFIGESIILALISAVVAICATYVVLPAFNTLVEKQLSIRLFQPLHISALLAISLICGLVAGSYPAFYLSSFNPVAVLKGNRLKTNGSAGFIRKGLVVVQFTISIILIISTIIIYQQINHAKNRSLGYDKENLIYLPLQGKLKEHFNAVKNDLVQTGIVKDAALSQSTILQLGSNTADFQWQGKDPDKQVLITVESVSPEYTSTMGMKLEKGRNFYSDIKSDSGNIIINQTLAKIIGGKNIIGSLITDGDNKFTVVGVIDDFVYNNLYSPSSPLILFPDTSGTNFLTIRLKKTSNVAGALEKVENVIKGNNPGFPFDYKFVDDQFDQFFKTEMLIGKLASVFAILAIFISCLGLFGLAAYTAERRTREIGIRKVLGASANGLAGLLSKEFLILVLISCLLAFPIAWWMMHNWLDSYEYRASISWPIFLVAGLLAMLIALLTVSVQAIKAALANPIQSLRSE